MRAVASHHMESKLSCWRDTVCVKISELLAKDIGVGSACVNIKELYQEEECRDTGVSKLPFGVWHRSKGWYVFGDLADGSIFAIDHLLASII